jgi:hypothetical protein
LGSAQNGPMKIGKPSAQNAKPQVDFLSNLAAV